MGRHLLVRFNCPLTCMKTNPPYPPCQGGIKKQPPQKRINSPLEGESQRPSDLCEGRCGGGSFSVACPPTESLAGFALSSSTPPQGGSESLLCSVANFPQGGSVSCSFIGFFTPLTRGGRGGYLCPLTRGFFNNPSLIPSNTHSLIAFDLRYAASQLLRLRGMRRAAHGENMESDGPRYGVRPAPGVLRGKKLNPVSGPGWSGVF